MDDRDRRQIEVGAGLQESRLNTELIEWLQKWGPRALYLLLAVVLAYLGWTKWQEHQQGQLDKAFAEYHAEQASRNPDVLLAIADKHAGKGSIWSLATLDASDIMLTAGRLGVRPGIGPNAATEEDMLSAERRQAMLRMALDHYQAVLSKNASDPDRTRFAQKARWGIVSAYLSLGEVERARQVLQEYIDVAEKHAFIDNVAVGKQRLELIDSLTDPIPLYTGAELPEENRPLVQDLGGAGSATFEPGTPGATTPDGRTIPLRRVDPEEARRRLGQTPPETNDTPAPEPSPEEPGADTPPESEPPAEWPGAPATPEPDAPDPGAEPE